MCFIVSSSIPVITALPRQKMKVFKKVDLHLIGRNVKIKSPYYNYTWFDGDVSKFPLIIRAEKIGVDFEGDFGDPIARGYHSYLSPMCDLVGLFIREDLIEKITFEKELTLELMLHATIPPNTKYRINTSGHVVSEDITLSDMAVVVDVYDGLYVTSYVSLHNLMVQRKINFRR